MAKGTLMTQLPKTQFSGLEFTNIMEDIHNLVRENPEYNSNWDDFLNSNAGRMLTEIFSWVADQLATRIDWVVNENFIGTATQRSSIIRLLKLIGYKFSLPVASTVPVTLEFSNPMANNFILTPTYIEGSGIFTPKRIQGIDKKGSLRTFEALNYDSTNQKYSYKVPVVVNTGSVGNPNLKQEINFYEGTTRLKTFIATSNQGQKFIISDTPVVRNSIAIYLIRTNGINVEEIELLEVDNFLDSRAQRSSDTQGRTNAIPYVLNTREDDSVEIEFGPITLLPTSDRRLPEGSEIRVFYRVGGGLDGNIARRAINLTEKVTFEGEEVVINYYNEREGIGGQDQESVEHAAYHGPLKIRTGGKTVTTEDYDIILASHTSILLSKSYGYNNIPHNYFDKYGTYFNPMEVVNYVIVKKPGWEDVPTSKYYLADWGSFNLENRFNGRYFFNNGTFGNPIKLKENKITFEGVYDYDNQGGKEFKNFTTLRTSRDWKESLFVEDEDGVGYIANKDLIASLTKMQYNKLYHTKIQQITDHLVYDINDPYLYGEYLDTQFPRIEMREDIHAYFRSNRDVSSGLNISNGRNRFIINIDNHGDIVIDLSRGGTSPNVVPLDTLVFGSTTIYGIIDTINEIVGNAYLGIHAYQDFGILIQDIMAQVPNLENRDEEDWILRISGVNYIVNTGVDQTYTNILSAMNTAINPHGYEALFIQNHVNITCFDIRIQRTTPVGTVILEDSNDPYDILVAFEAAPLSTTPVSSGDYSNVATKVIDSDGAYVKLTSPNKGSASSVVLKPSVSLGQNCLLSLFGLDIDYDERDVYTCYGQRSLTIIYRDNNEPDFGDFIYEHGTINFSVDDPEFIYLNYIKKRTNRIKLGYYFNENFDVSDPEWKPIDKRIYNTLYKVDPDDLEGKREYFDIDNSNLLLRFTAEEERGNSIYTISSDYNLIRATPPKITSRFMHSFPDLTGKNLTIQISDNFPKIILLDNVTNMGELSAILNDNFNEEANEMFRGIMDFTRLDVDQDGKGTIIFQIDNNKSGKIIVLGNSNSAGNLFFSEIANPEHNFTKYADGDFYLEHNTSTDTIDMVKIESAENVPDIPFYVHYVSDKRHKFLDPDIKKEHTDEDDLQAFMYPYKVAGVQNVFRRPVFTTFDLKADIFCSRAIPREQIQFNVDKALRDYYSIASAEFNKPIIRSEVTKIIMDVPGVRYVEVKYFGKDMKVPSSNLDNRLDVGFDEIAVLSDDTYDSSGSQTHGKDLTYNVV
jgi:hypothetical protein